MAQKYSILIMFVLLTCVLSLKPSEAGVNDWHVNSIGEIDNAFFFKNKIIFHSKLNMFGQIDRPTGLLDSRITLSSNERVIAKNNKEMILATAYNQIIIYTHRSTGIERTVDNRFISENSTNRKLISYSKQANATYYLFNNALYADSNLVKNSIEGEKFIKIINSNLEDEILIVSALEKTGQLCVDLIKINKISQINNEFKNCFSSVSQDDFLSMHLIDQTLILELRKNVLLYNKQSKEIKKLNRRLIDIVGSELIISSDGQPSKNNQISSFNLQSQVEKQHVQYVQTARDQFQYQIKIVEEEVILHKQDSDQQVILSFPHQSATSILRAWLNYHSEWDYDLLVQFSDLQLVLVEKKKNQPALLKWTKEESLSEVEQVLFMKYAQHDGLDNQYHKFLITHSKTMTFIEKVMHVPADVVHRLTEEVNDLQTYIFSQINKFINLVQSYNGKIGKFQMDEQQEIHYGLRKYIFILTKKGTILSIDTKTKQLLWKTFLPEDQRQNKIVKFLKLKKNYETQSAILITYNPKSHTVHLNQIEESSNILELKRYNQINQIPMIYKINQHSLYLKSQQSMERYDLIDPSSEEYVLEHHPNKQYYFYSINKEENSITGYKSLRTGDIIQIWNFYTSNVKTEKILKYSSSYRGDQFSPITLYDNDKVFYKNVDYTNIAVVTSYNSTNLNLYIINGVTGSVLFNQYKNAVSTSLHINLIYDQNNVLLSYYNLKNRMYEIWAVEQYQEQMEYSAINMIKNYIHHNQYTPKKYRNTIISQSQFFASPVSIKFMDVTQTKMALSRKNLMIITNQNKLYMYIRDFVSTRRPRKLVAAAERNPFTNDKYPEYTHILPYIPFNFFSYDVNLHNLEHLAFSSTDMESSIFILAYGIDLFLIRMAPDKTFDMITEDFNHYMLLIILAVATGIVLFLRSKVLMAKLKKPHTE